MWQAKDLSPLTIQAQQEDLGDFESHLDPKEATYLDRLFSIGESTKSLRKLGKGKNFGWDGIFTRSCIIFWEGLKHKNSIIPNTMFKEGKAKGCVKKGTNIFVPKQASIYIVF